MADTDTADALAVEQTDALQDDALIEAPQQTGINWTFIERSITTALEEDIGEGDVTSNLVIPVPTAMQAQFTCRENCVIAGMEILKRLFARIKDHVTYNALLEDGVAAEKGDVIATLEGSAHGILLAERTALNLLQRCTSIATLTNRYVQAVAHTKAVILDTRKTMPCLRDLDKYAVVIGGGDNHRMRLDDMVMMKDNHLAHVKSIKEAVKKARAGIPETMLILVECDTETQAKAAFKAGADRLLLDNMSAEQMEKIVALRDKKYPEIRLEASGGITLENVAKAAETGVDFISIGALTHSVTQVDIGLDIS